MLWAALIPSTLPADPSARIKALTGLASWALQYTPRVALIEPLHPAAALVMEVQASQRLFGGRRRLVARVRAEATGLGIERMAWAPYSLAAVALARAGRSNGFRGPLASLLDPLPVETLSGVEAHRATLARLGCPTLGAVRALPRGGLSRRFDGGLLAALDQAYGLRPEVHRWITPPEVFDVDAELMSRVELAPALMFAARRLLQQLAGWLAARQCGVTAFTLRWTHDDMRAKSAGTGGQITVRTAKPTRDVEHLARLLGEHLAKQELLASVGHLGLRADEVSTMVPQALTLLPEPAVASESQALMLERMAARFGAGRVVRPVLQEDHRPEWMCRWQPAAQPRPRSVARSTGMPQATVLLAEPLRLATRGHRPLYQGVLHLVLGPDRVEGGWWDRYDADGQQLTRNVTRDYWVALSDHARPLWIYQTRLAGDEDAWFLHGIFA